MVFRPLTVLSLSLMRVSGWQMAPLPILQRHAQCASFQTSARHAAPPQMCSDRYSSEFQRLTEQRTGTVFGEPLALLRQHKVDSAWVLLFNAGERNEGVYTLQGRENLVESHGTYVLAFEQLEEASQFAMLLQAQGFDKSTATSWTANLLSEFCSTADFKMGFVPDKALLVPPHKNVYVDHHELANPPQPDSVDASASAPDTADGWGCSGADGAELCANLERLFDLEN